MALISLARCIYWSFLPSTMTVKRMALISLPLCIYWSFLPSTMTVKRMALISLPLCIYWYQILLSAWNSSDCFKLCTKFNSPWEQHVLGQFLYVTVYVFLFIYSSAVHEESVSRRLTQWITRAAARGETMLALSTLWYAGAQWLIRSLFNCFAGLVELTTAVVEL